jgi:hypothetical protein
LSLLTRFFGRTASEGAAFALGTAVGPALSPAVRELVNEAWTLYPTRPLDAASLAEIVAEDVAQLQWGRDQAAQNGISGGKFDALVQAVENAPGVPELFALWRRGLIDEAAFTHGLRKTRFEPRWDESLKALRNVLLSPDTLANARQQGFVDVARQHSESELQGVTNERADILFELSGNPPGPAEGLEMLRRGIITEAEFVQVVREGRIKTKYTDEYLALRTRLLNPGTLVELHLKGWIDAATYHDRMAAQGYTAAEADDWYNASGRPAAPTQMATAVARGIDGPAGRPMDREQFLEGIAQSNIHPRWGPMLWGVRFAYPPLFQISRLVQGGAIDVATAVTWAEKDRYAPEVVSALREYWSQPTAAAASGYTAKAKTQLWTTTHNSYIAFESNKTEAGSALARLGVPVAERADVLALWDAERDLRRKQLTPAQVKKAYLKPVRNPATGAPWTRDDALAALLERGYSTADANTFLDE